MLDKDNPQKNYASFQQIVFESKNQVTSPKEIYFNNNFKISPLVHLDNISLSGKDNELVYYLIHTGGGYLTGETVGSNFILKRNSKATLTTVSPSNIYMCKEEESIKAEEYIKVEENAYLTYICDDIIAFEKSKYFQFNIFELDKKAHLIYSDMIGPGWSQKDIDFSFDIVKVRSEFYCDNEIICLDNLRFEPKELDLHALGCLDNYLYMSTVFFYDEQVSDELVLKLRSHLKQTIKFEHEFGISKINDHFLIVRILTKLEEDGNRFVLIISNWLRENVWKMPVLNFKKY